jgi:type IV/VI secretion system ImpK/VasF family protein
LFSRKKKPDVDVEAELTRFGLLVEREAVVEDAVVSSESLFVEERAVAEEKISAPAPAARDAESVWDDPLLGEPGATPPALDANDFQEVWKRRISPIESIDWKSLEAPPTKAGFVSRLFSRKKKDEPRAAEEDVRDLRSFAPAEADFSDDPAASAAPSHDDFAPAAPAHDDFAPAAPPPPAAATPVDVSDLDETVPHPMPAVPSPAIPARDDLESTHRFPPFRDARDDFAEDEARERRRSTQLPGMSDHDLDAKTDEFEVVPPPMVGPGGSTAETRQVAGFLGRVFGRKDDVGMAAMATRGLPDERTPFVLAKFRGFYNEVIRDKHQKSDVISGFATAVMGAGGASTESDPEFAAQLLSKRLSEMLELQAAESNWTGGDAAKYYPDAQYAMVALADETFATIDWPGRPSWHKYMLEPKMYGTRGADVEFFKRIDRLLKENADEKGARDLARLYLMVIASGFRGKFRIPNVRRPLAEYRRRLYEYSHQRDPLELYARERRVFPQAAINTLVSRSVGRFTPAQKWVAVALILAVLYFGVSHYAWRSVSADLRDVMSRIQTSISQQASSSSPTR